MQKGVLKNFAKFTRKHLCHSILFSHKVAGLRSAILLKNRLWRRYFLMTFVKFSRTPILKNIYEWLLLNTIITILQIVG